ncbi:MAG TPA: decarboxylating 6-phosphogluconate dehydrogenase [Burkholderiaceae bacterium]|nr:decarboxylating 6-phosphogluconate dehydrogenase [Burkholderiaceae bacterium]
MKEPNVPLNTPAPTLAMIGLGRMGANMARRLARAGAIVHGFDAAQASRDALSGEPGVRVYPTLQSALAALPLPRIVWLMLPAGAATVAALAELRPRLSPGDVVVDGGNANYLESQQRARELGALGVRFADCGVSGGVWGLENGYCLMFGADAEVAPLLEPSMQRLAPSPTDGWLHCGPVGSGHFAKMIHNGIEYGMMQAIAEGFALLEGKRDFELDLAAIAQLWRHGSVVRSWLLDLTANALADPQALAGIAPVVADSGEGRWTVDEAIRQGTPAPVIALAMMCRFTSQGRADTANRLLALMRKGFGGHPVIKA